MQTPYQQLGDDGIRQLAEAFYRAMDTLPAAAEIRAMHGNDLSEITEKLADYLTGWMGGPPRYQQKYGTVCLTDPHAHYAIDAEARDQWLLCMNRALEEIGASDELKKMLNDPLYRVADAVRNQPD